LGANEHPAELCEGRKWFPTGHASVSVLVMHPRPLAPALNRIVDAARGALSRAVRHRARDRHPRASRALRGYVGGHGERQLGAGDDLHSVGGSSVPGLILLREAIQL
jgi:hypothetical protein